MHGRGNLLFEDGRRYIGELAEDVLSGYGIFLWPDGRRY
jgi:hypothetical protein